MVLPLQDMIVWHNLTVFINSINTYSASPIDNPLCVNDRSACSDYIELIN